MHHQATNYPFVDTKLRQTVKFMRLNGLIKLKTADYDLELSPQAISMRPKKGDDKEEDVPSTPQYSQEDVLFWSSAGMMFPEEDNA